jgi:hypothetical protein
MGQRLSLPHVGPLSAGVFFLLISFFTPSGPPLRVQNSQMSVALATSILNLQNHMDVECRMPECKLECNAYIFLMFPVMVLATIFALELPLTAELFKRLTGVGGLWLEAVVLMWLTAWPAFTVLLILMWGKKRRCW